MKMQGEWLLTEFELRNEYSTTVLPPEDYEGQLIIKGDNVKTVFVFKNRDKIENSYRLRLDSTKSPRHFDAIFPKAGTLRGIYEIDGDTLRRCVTSRLDGPRLTVLRRASTVCGKERGQRNKVMMWIPRIASSLKLGKGTKKKPSGEKRTAK